MRRDTERGSAHDARAWRRSLWLGVVLVVLLVGAIAVLPRRPHTYRAAVAALLERRDMLYREIVVGELQPMRPGDCLLPPCGGMAAHVTVIQERAMVGRMVCHVSGGDCALTLTALHIYNEPLPNLESAQHFPRTLQEMELVVRAWVRNRIVQLGGG